MLDETKKEGEEILPLVVEKTGELVTGQLLPGVVVAFPEIDSSESLALPDIPDDSPWVEDINPNANELLPVDNDSDRIELPPLTEQEYTVAFELIPAAESLTSKVQRDAAVRKFHDLVKDGVDPRVAAGRIQRNIPQSPWIKKTFRELLENFHWNADIDREIVRSARRKVLLEALEDGDRKAASAMMKQIAEDPQVGLSAPAVTINSIDMGDLKDLMGKVSRDMVVDIPKELVDS